MMKHIGTQTLRTERLTLRRPDSEDAIPMFANWASDPEVTRYLTWPAHDRVEVTQWVLDSWIRDSRKADFYQWMIVPDFVGEPIGTISAVRIDDAAGEIEVGYCIGRLWWHRGIVSEALQAVMHFFFREVGASRISARHDSRNPHSGAVMRKCGMVYDRTEIAGDRNNQGICDAVYYVLARENWTNFHSNSGTAVV